MNKEIDIMPFPTELAPEMKAMLEWMKDCEKAREERFRQLFYIPNWIILKSNEIER